MKKTRVAVPWNNASYLPCNGFHPLYQALFDDSSNAPVQFNVLDELAFADKLIDREIRNGILADVARIHDRLSKKWQGLELGEEFLQYVSAEDFWLTSALPGDIEFHHTSPLVTGERPFVFHCESFLPVFMPFAYQGQGEIKNPSKIREFYRSLLADDTCLSIHSHLPETLDNLARFFSDPKLENKLRTSRTGLSNATFRQLGIERNERDRPPRFLFTSSAHQQMVAFKLRGGFSALGFAYKYLNERRLGKFIFRCSRPADADLRHYGVDLTWLREAENLQLVIWAEGFLPEHEQLALFRASDFFLLPSLNLHSVSIMQAQLAGAIPVVTDILGTDRFVADDSTGILLSEVRNTVWRKDAALGVDYDDHRLWSPELAAKLADEMYRRVSVLLDAPYACEALRRNMRERATSAYCGGLFRQELFAALDPEQRQTHCGQSMAVKDLPLHPSPPILFDSPPVPIKELSLEGVDAYRVKGLYWLFSRELDLGSLRAWSVMYWASCGLLKTPHMDIAANLGGLSGQLLPIDEASPTNILLKLEDNFKRWVRRFPSLASPLRRIFPMIKPVILAMEKMLLEEDETVHLMKRHLILWLKSLNSTMPQTYKKSYSSFVTWRKQLRRYRLLRFAASLLRWLATLLSIAFRLLFSILKKVMQRINRRLGKYKRWTDV